MKQMSNSILENNPIEIEKKAEKLLEKVDHIRDPVHGDIHLTALERFIIDTDEFQRLRKINQLAMTYMVYPGALHTRFIHSIGTLHICSKMIETCNRNAKTYRSLKKSEHISPLKMTPYTELLTRLCALLHDMAHVPFGHTFEKEGRIFELDEWKDPMRKERIFGKNSNFAKKLIDFLKKYGIEEKSVLELLGEIEKILSTDKNSIWDLKYPFIHDLIGNTICADLIDYIIRDSYFCGLTEGFGNRFLQYLAILPVKISKKKGKEILFPNKEFTAREVVPNGDCRVVLLQYRYNEYNSEVIKHDIITEAIDLIRRRLGISEKIYFHRTKMVASAMLITAAYSHKLKAEDIYNCSDMEVIDILVKSSKKRATHLAEKLQKRQLFKPIYKVSYQKEEDTLVSDRLWDEKKGAYRFCEPAKRQELIEKLEELIRLMFFQCKDNGNSIGTVAISCPDRNMNLKAFDMLVLKRPDKQIIKLQESDNSLTQLEIKAIQETHENLWKLEIFVDPEVAEKLQKDRQKELELIAAIEDEIGFRNENRDLDCKREVSRLIIKYFLDNEIKKNQLETVLTISQKNEIEKSLEKFNGDFSKIKTEIKKQLKQFKNKNLILAT